ncbi:hypothetical protein [uncultured Cohaesibacter sp.]|uniref:hypothetical protein n=1 Tax=uncultured Cohaesibacter sp. TaxID=1002546 RepID=UPI0029C8EEE5|nr:hypothetical protein [uncultured Cohaesibacter sp.]
MIKFAIFFLKIIFFVLFFLLCAYLLHIIWLIYNGSTININPDTERKLTVLAPVYFLFLLIGGTFVKIFGVWTYILLGSGIALLFYLGLKNVYILTFGIFECIGLIAGFLWVDSVYQKDDIGGFWAWHVLIGVWSTTTLIVVIMWLFSKLDRQRYLE